MIDFNKYESVRDNPMVSKEFFRSISPYDFFQIIKNDSHNEYQLVDLSPVIDGVVESDDPTKLLLLCSQSKLGQFLFSSDTFKSLYGKSDAVNESLFSNSRFDWYGVFVWNDDDIGNSILNYLRTAPDSTKQVFYSNPRMDRSIIKSIIAKESDNDKFGSEIDQFSIEDRFLAVKFSVNVKEIPSKIYPGKDSPDSNELDFDKPSEAILQFVRDMFNELPEPSFRYTLEQLNFYLSDTNFGIDIYHWLSDDERNSAEILGSDFNDKHTELVKRAFLKMVDFLDDLTKSIDVRNVSSYKSDSEYKEYSELANFSPSTFSIIAINKLLDDYWIRSSKKDLIYHLISSENWVLRSAAYSYLFNGVIANPDDDDDLLKQFKSFYDRYSSDRLSLIHGIFNSTHLHLIQYQSYLARQYVNEIVEDLDVGSDFIKFLTSDLSYVFDNYRNLDHEELGKIYNDKFRSENTRIIKQMIASKSETVPNVIPKAPIDLNIKQPDDSRSSLTYQLGQSIGKLFK